MFKNNYPLIGILGGMGPYAGLDVVKKIFSNTIASIDQEHIPTLLASLPHEIPGRPEFLMHKQPINPGKSMAELALWLEKSGATHCAVPCNTAHAFPIWDLMLEELKKENSKLIWVHILEELQKEINETVGSKKARKNAYGPLRMGIIATTGTIQTKLYDNYFNDKERYTLVYPSESAQEATMDAIFNKKYGLKASSDIFRNEAKEKINEVMLDLKAQHVDVYILGCTELSFALPEPQYYKTPCIDPLTIQARALIKATYPERLKGI